ncbi:DEAD/DEAH box helicase family protein [Pseudomonas veronii]
MLNSLSPQPNHTPTTCTKTAPEYASIGSKGGIAVPNFFVEQAGTLNLFQQQRTPNHGFRPGQLGALHAVLAHFSVQDDPAIVCLPTGYGKTSLMMALPMLLGPARVLIVEPSSALRKQVHSHISVMSTLRRIGALAEDCPLPDVHRKRPARPPSPRAPLPASSVFFSRGFTWKRCTRGASPGPGMSRPGATVG